MTLQVKRYHVDHATIITYHHYFLFVQMIGGAWASILFNGLNLTVYRERKRMICLAMPCEMINVEKTHKHTGAHQSKSFDFTVTTSIK